MIGPPTGNEFRDPSSPAYGRKLEHEAWAELGKDRGNRGASGNGAGGGFPDGLLGALFVFIAIFLVVVYLIASF